MTNNIRKSYGLQGAAGVATLIASFGAVQAEDASTPTDAGVDPAAQCLEPQLPLCSDAQVEAILRAANQAEVDLVEAVLDRLTTPSVRDYAELLRDDHTLALQELDAVIATTGIQPQENDISEQITESGQVHIARLEQESGAELERDFLAHALLGHLQTLSTSDHVLLPSAQRPELVQLLETLRPELVEHTERGADVQTDVVGACGGTTEPPGGDAGATPP